MSEQPQDSHNLFVVDSITFLLVVLRLIVFYFCREETEIIEGEVVEIQIDRPATGTVGVFHCYHTLKVLKFFICAHTLFGDVRAHVHYMLKTT